MKKWLFVFLLLSLAVSVMAQDAPKASLPVLTTSAGQSADINTLNVILDQAGVGYDYCDVPTVEMMQDGVGLGGRESGEGFHVEIYTDTDTYAEGSSYKTIIFAIGASLKGMGASGLTIDDELNRLKGLIAFAKKNKMFIVAVHAGGESKRGPSGSDNEKVIDAVAPFADYIIAVTDSNKDGRFTKIVKEKNISYSEVQYALGIVDLMKKLFQ